MLLAIGESLSASEASSVTGVPLKHVNRIIDAGLLRNYAKSKGRTRSISLAGLIGLRLAYLTASTLTPAARQRIIAKALSGKNQAIVEDAPLQVDIRPILADVEAGLNRLERARDAVSIQSDVMGGQPVFVGTRIPIYDVTEMLTGGDTREAIIAAFPQLSLEKLNAAADYALAYPKRGRPVAKPEWRNGEAKTVRTLKLDIPPVKS